MLLIQSFELLLPNSSGLKSLGCVEVSKTRRNFISLSTLTNLEPMNSIEEHEEEEDGDSGTGLKDAGLPIPVLVLEIANLRAGLQLEHSASE